MNNDLLLIFPPGWTPFAPYLALPQLKGYLNTKQLDVDICDDNVHFFDYILTNKYLKDKISNLLYELEVLESKNILTSEEIDRYKRLVKIKIFSQQLENIEVYKDRLRACKSLSKKLYGEIVHVLSVALDVVSLYYNQNIDFYDISFNTYNRTNPVEIVKALYDSENNIFVDYYNEKRKKSILEKNYKYIGFSITSKAQLIPALTLAKQLREKQKELVIFFGGNYITRLVEQKSDQLDFLFEYIDFISIYEGEYTLEKLITSKATRRKIKYLLPTIFGVAYMKNSQLLINKTQEFHIDNVACPNFDGFELELYMSPVLILPLYSSKNCYSNCSFCTISGGTSGRKYKKMSLDNVYKFMNNLSVKYSTDYFTFVDETFPIKRLVEFSKIIIENEPNKYKWYTETRFDDHLSVEQGKLLYEAGCRKLQFGLESYNQRVLDLMNKRIKIRDVVPTLESCLESQIAFHLFFMVGFPGETESEANRTIKFVENMLNKASRVYGVQECSKGYSIFGLEKGSNVFANPEQYGIEIVDRDRNDLDISYKYITKNGLRYEDSKRLLDQKILKRSSVLNFDLAYVLAEEMSLFFSDFIDSNYNQEQLTLTNRSVCVKLKHDLLTGLKSPNYLYYHFLDNVYVQLEHAPLELSSVEKEILKTYGFLETDIVHLDNSSYFMINPYIAFTEIEEDGVIECVDTVSGNKYSMNHLTFESLNVLNSRSYLQLRNVFCDNEIYTECELATLMSTLIDCGLVLNINNSNVS